MAKSILSRMVSLFSPKQKKPTAKPIQKPTKSIDNITLPLHDNIIESSRKQSLETQSPKKDLILDRPSQPPQSQPPPSTITSEANEESDMGRFINIQGDLPKTQDYINKLEQCVNRAYHQSSDEYSTISSATSSANMTLEEALFSHISSDSRSEITAYSFDSPKIAVRAQSSSRSSLVQSDVRQYQIADLDPPAHHADSMGGSTPKIIFDTHLAISKSNYERYFCNLYTQALYYLSPLNKGYSPAHAFELFEAIAAHGSQIYQELNPRTKTLISFAQYRAGRMLYEAEYSEEDDRYSHHQQQGLIYLCDAQKNGNAHATYILGIYTQERGNLDQACQLYHEAAMAGLVEAKVSFAITVLYHHVSTFKAEDAIKALIEASNQGHSLASFLLAAYYDQEQQFQTAAKYGQRVRLSSASPIYGLTKYVIGIIHLKAGYEDAAFQYVAEAANSTQIDDRGMPIKNTLALRKLGLFFLLGIGTPKKPEVAFQYIKKAADCGDEVANIILGQMFILGLGCTIDRMEAAQIFEKYKDSIAAKLSRGLLFMKINPEIAYQEFVSVMNFNPTPYDEKNWNIASIRCEATVRIAIWTFNGIGGAEKNPQYAVQLLQKLSDQYNYPEAHYWLAWAYYEGVLAHDDSTIATKDVNKAFHYFLKGAQMNNAKSLYKVGLMLRDGEVTHPQFQRQDAFQFFFKAAGLNHVEAQTQVGIYYFHGLAPVTRNLETAFEYFSLAARHNNTEAILYLADYFVKSSTQHSSINVKQLYNELNRSASAQNPAAYRMLALVINKLTDPSESYEPILRSSASNHQALWSMYQMAKEESYSNIDVKTRFALHCLWKALELTDHKSGRFVCTFIPKMTTNDVSRTIEIFQRSEGPNTQKMSVAFAQFLNACGKKSFALKKYLEIARFNNVNETAGWVARLEAAKLVLLENQGKARSKDMVFNYLQEMVDVNGKNLFLPYFLLARCHEKEICKECNKSSAISLYEDALRYKANNDQTADNAPDALLEVNIRSKLVKTYYESYQDKKLETQLNMLENLLKKLGESRETKEATADLLYYKGLVVLHNYNILNNREKAEAYLSKSCKLDHVLARLELGYLYGTSKGKEDLADACFTFVEESNKTLINFQGRVTETTTFLRSTRMKNPAEDYPKEFIQMKLAAAITYSLYDMERQAVDWLREIPHEPLSQIMLLYYEMKNPANRKTQTIRRLSALMAPFETDHSLDYNARTILSYGQFRLGQCFELGHGVSKDDITAMEYYNKACAFLKSNEMYEKLAEISQRNGSTNAADLFPTLYNAAHNNKDATFKLAQYYESQGTPESLGKAITYFRKAANLGHTEACYYYAKYMIKKKMQTAVRQEGAASNLKNAADYLRLAASRNHGPAFYELGMLEMKAGLYEEGVEDLLEANFLGCSDASYQLGELYFTGFIGVVQDQVVYKMGQNYETSLSYYTRAYEKNPGHLLTMIKIGTFYEQGLSVEQNLAEAKRWYTKARSLGAQDGIAEYALGCLEETNLALSGLRPTNSLRKAAYDWFLMSYNLGNRDAKFKVGVYLLNNWVDPHSSESEKRGLEMLIEENNNSELKAMIVLAKYFEKKGEYEKAFDYWRNAEMLDDPEALEYIGKCYELGLLGQEVNLEEAHAYKQRAMEARKHAKETQCSVMGFRSDCSDERN